MKTPLWKKHIYFCQNKGFIGIKVEIIMIKSNPKNLRLYEAF